PAGRAARRPSGVTPPAAARAIGAAAAAALGAPVRDARPVAGGDLNDAYALELGDGTPAFAKTAAGAVPGTYAAEAAGLRWLAAADAVAVPDVLAVADPPAGAPHHGPRLLVLSWVRPGRAGPGAAEALGRGLARLHAAGAESFGAPAPGTPPDAAGEPAPLRLGPLVLPGAPAASWHEAYAEGRLRPLARRAVDAGALPAATARRVERVCARLPELAGPPEPPARLHGDLWSGNVLHDGRGRPVLIDPAAYGGHREVDLAMLALFGNPAPALLRAYDEVRPRAPGHEERVALWQLLPLLVHAVLFGGSYGAAVDRAARRYA
ncbi:MAG TPA: fructosamine kinase family protein, partial [Solirubrobacteraceae bacterium]|nr:fructosamine kinase family protein [Solirubrobacteraceae bacterium]